MESFYIAKTTILNILLKLAFTVVWTANTNLKVIVHSNVAVGYFKLGELNIHCGKTTISNFKLLIHLNLVAGQFELGE